MATTEITGDTFKDRQKLNVACYCAPSITKFNFVRGDFSYETLVGVYDLYYVYYHSIEINIERTSRGSMKIYKLNDDGRDYLCGDVSLHPDHQKIFHPIHTNFSFHGEIVGEDNNCSTGKRKQKNDSMKFTVDYLDENSIPVHTLQEYGFFSVDIIAERIAACRFDDDNFNLYYKKPVNEIKRGRKVYNSIEEAELDQKRKRRDYSKSWLCNHFSPLDSLVAEKIYSYVSYKPEPVLWFEKGDVVTHFFCHEEIQVPCSGYLVFRRRSQPF